jgi:hypothetical protein
MYRYRLTVAAGQAGRLNRILTEGLGAMDLSEEAFIAVALVPTGAGSMPIDLARVAAVGEWARTRIGPANLFEGLFDAQAPPAAAGVAAHRLTLTTIYETNAPPGWLYAELYDDGAGFACHRLTDPRRGWMGGEQRDAWVLNEQLLFVLSRCLLLLGRHAAENCGAWGDALVEARIVSEQPSRLAYIGGTFNRAEEIAGGRGLSSPVVSDHTAVIDGLARPRPQLLVTTRMLATDLFHAYGSPEVRQITSDGQLRTRYIHGVDAELQAWAGRHGIGLTDETTE